MPSVCGARSWWPLATALEADQYGHRYILDFEMEGPRGRAIVRSLWIVRSGEAFPRFVTCFVL